MNSENGETNKAAGACLEKELLDKILAKKTFGIIGWGFFAFVSATVVTQQVSAITIHLLNKTGAVFSGMITYLISFLPLYLIAFPIMLLIIKKLPKDNAEKKDINILTLIKYFCMCITIMYVGNIIGTWLSSFISEIFGKTSNNNLAELIMNTDMLSTAIFVVILGPIMEEIIFRKILIDRTVKFGERNAMFLSALMFGLFHMNLFQFFYAFGIGIIFAYMYIRSRRIEYSIIFHIIINFLGSIVAVQIAGSFGEGVMDKLHSGNPELVVEALSPGIVLSVIYFFIIIVIFFVGFVFIIVDRKKMKLDINGAPFTRKEEKGLVYGNYGMAFFIAACLVMMIFTTMAQMS
nr:type II CAAX endopeptidase family protein [uncultured Catonella sp.]